MPRVETTQVTPRAEAPSSLLWRVSRETMPVEFEEKDADE